MFLLMFLGCPDPVPQPVKAVYPDDLSSDEDGGLLNCARGTDDKDCYVTCSGGKKVFWEDPCPMAVNQRYWK